jgi:hypothetical protein
MALNHETITPSDFLQKVEIVLRMRVELLKSCLDLCINFKQSHPSVKLDESLDRKIKELNAALATIEI